MKGNVRRVGNVKEGKGWLVLVELTNCFWLAIM